MPKIPKSKSPLVDTAIIVRYICLLNINILRAKTVFIYIYKYFRIRKILVLLPGAVQKKDQIAVNCFKQV